MKLPYAVATLVVLILCWAVASSLIDRGPAPEQLARDARLELLEDSLPRLEARVRTSDIETRRAQEDAARERARADSARARAQEEGAVQEERARQAGAALRATMDSLRASVPDELVPLVDVAIEQERAQAEAVDIRFALLATEIGALEIQLAGADRVIAAQARQIETRDSLNVVLTEGWETEAASSEYWKKEANPGFFGWLKRDAGKVVGLAVAIVGGIKLIG